MRSAAFFDLDKTLWACSGEKAFAGHQFRRGKLGITQLGGVVYQYLRYELGLIDDIDTLKRRVLRALFAGEAVAPCIEVYSAHFRQQLSRELFPEMLDCVKNHQQAGDKIVIVSAALDFIVSPVAELLQADDCFAIRLEVTDHLFSGEVLGPIPYGQAKAAIVRDYANQHGLDLAQCHAYGDHWEDRYMLSAVGRPVAVNPDRRLAQLAQRQQWQTLVLPSPL
ncbi:MAG: HAD family hydrolase [Methylobacter sp.]